MVHIPPAQRPTPATATQTAAAMAQTDVVLFLVDARAGMVPVDRGFADLVRKSGKPAILVANKSEGRAGEAGMLDAYSLGLGDPVAISAEPSGTPSAASRAAIASFSSSEKATPADCSPSLSVVSSMMRVRD